MRSSSIAWKSRVPTRKSCEIFSGYARSVEANGGASTSSPRTLPIQLGKNIAPTRRRSRHWPLGGLPKLGQIRCTKSFATRDRSEEGAMRAFSLGRRHRSLPNVFVQSWRRWMARRADQLLETARLGSDNLEYLTHNPKATDSELCLVASGHADDLLRR